ncbi:6643_t:CDS:1, partial [Funneliformis caledonium]
VAEQRVIDRLCDQESQIGTSKRPENGSKNTLPKNKRQKK